MPDFDATIRVLALTANDSDSQLGKLGEVFGHVGFTLQSALTLECAMEAIHLNVPDLLLVDLTVQGHRAVEFCERVKSEAISADVPILLLTSAQHDLGSLMKAIAAGAGDYIDINVPCSWLRKKTELLVCQHREAAKSKKAQEALRESEDRYRDLVENSTDLLCTHDLDGLLLSANQAVIKLTGYDPKDFVNKRNIREILAPEFRDRFEMYLAALKRLGTATGVMQVVTSSGERRIWEFTNSLRTEGLPAPIVRGMAHDITDRWNAEIALRESEARYRRIVETTEQGVWTIDANDRTTFVNAKMAHMLGYTPDEMQGMSLLNFVHEEDAPLAQNTIERSRLGLREHQDFRFRRKDGSDLWTIVATNPIYDKNSEYAGALAMVSDITDRKRLEQQLLQAQKMEAVGRLAGGLAHDFNNLLTAILGYSELSLPLLQPGSPLRGNFEQIKKAATKASSLTAQLLAFGRRQVLQPRVLNLNDVVTEMNKILCRLIGEDIDLATCLGSGLERVKVDPSQIEQVILNLAVNSRDAMPDGGRLTIETANVNLDESYAQSHPEVQPGPYVMLAVSDSGCGMDEDTKAQIFEPFFTTKEMGKGSGLGLSTVYGIVNQSGGHIWTYSEPGHGTTFKIYFPAFTEPCEDHGPVHEGSTASGGSETILLVEDDDAVRGLASEILRTSGYKVLEAPSADDALRICEKHGSRIDLLLSDVVMPKMSGRRLAQLLTQSFPHLKVLYMSGYTENAIVHHGVLELDIAFLQKPFTPEALTARVRDTLSAPRQA